MELSCSCIAWKTDAGISTYALFALIALTAGMGIASCAMNRATGERQLNLIGESRESAMGQQSDLQVVS
jgi:hypothetical protein